MNIVAIGGGKKEPAIAAARERLESQNVILVPSACSTDTSYARKVGNCATFFTEIGMNVSVLHEFREIPSNTRIEHELGAAALAYVIGGNTPYMMRTLAEHGSDDAIKRFIEQDKTIAGTSAGALLPFEIGQSCPARRPAEEDWEYAYVKMLGSVPAAAVVHADQHDPTLRGLMPGSRLDNIMSAFPEGARAGFAIDNGAALLIHGNTATIQKVSSEADVHFLSRDPEEGITIATRVEDDTHISNLMTALYKDVD